MVAEKYPGWYEEYLDVKSASGIAEIVGDFRDYIQSDIANFHGRPELPHLVQYLWDRDQVAMELYKKAVNSGNPDMETLGHPANSELREYWTGLRVMYAMIPDFQEVYTRYFEGDETIGRNSWPQGLRMLKNRRLIEQQSEVA